MSQDKQQCVSLFGVRVNNVSMAGAIEILDGLLTGNNERSRSIYFVNAHTLNRAYESPDYVRVLNRGDHVFGDGTGVRWAMRLLGGVESKGNVNGTDLVPSLIDGTARRGYRLFLLGNTPERIAHAAEFVERRFTGWSVPGYHHGYVSQEVDMSIVNQINAARPHLLLVGMGNPLQEYWIDKHLAHLTVPVCMGIGGLFDYWAGNLDRAPAWMRRTGHEWLHILIRQPKKFGRYVIGNPKFLARIARSKYQAARRGSP